MDKALWEHIFTFVHNSSINAVSRVNKFLYDICAPYSHLWLKLLKRENMISQLYFTPHTNWKLLYKLAYQMLHWDPACLHLKATQCLTLDYLLPILYNAEISQEKGSHLPHIKCVSLIGLPGAGRGYFLTEIFPKAVRNKIEIIHIRDSPEPTALERAIDKAIEDQDPLVIVVDDLTAMNGVYSHPFVHNLDYAERFKRVIQKVKNTENQILLLVSINMDDTALRLFAGVVTWDQILYFGIPALHKSEKLLNSEVDQDLLKTDYPELVSRIKGSTLSEIVALMRSIIKEKLLADMRNIPFSLTSVLEQTEYMKRPVKYNAFASLLRTLPFQSELGVVLVNSSDNDECVANALVAKKVMREHH